MKSPHEKVLGKGYKKGVTRGDLIKHKAVNLRNRMSAEAMEKLKKSPERFGGSKY